MIAFLRDYVASFPVELNGAPSAFGQALSPHDSLNGFLLDVLADELEVPEELAAGGELPLQQRIRYIPPLRSNASSAPSSRRLRPAGGTAGALIAMKRPRLTRTRALLVGALVIAFIGVAWALFQSRYRRNILSLGFMGPQEL